jgi:hypothetical protein
MANNNDNCNCTKKIIALEKKVKQLEAQIALLMKVIRGK